MTKVALKDLPPAEAIKYFEGKGYKLGYSWQDTWQEEHARAFTVAKAMRYDILQDIRGAMDAPLRDGTTFDDFKKRLTPILQEKGWWGRQSMTDPLTGETKNVQLGSPRRLGIIFDVNMRTSYAAGHWERIQRSKKTRPYLMYVAVMDGRTRPQHRAWNAIVLPIDHPFWQTHYPPNGWKCRCTVLQLSQRDLDDMGLSVSTDAEVETFLKTTKEFRNNRTGEITRVPEGIDPGFAYNVGKAHMRSVTPPPLDGPLGTPAVAPPAHMPMPASRRATAADLLPLGKPDEFYVDRFLEAFGATRDKPALFRDALDEPVMVGADLFRTRDGHWKVKKRGREKHLLLLASAIRDPDEIWWLWQIMPDGNAGLRRRYLKRVEIDGETKPLLASFEIGRDGWEGVTAFPPDEAAYLDKQRRGTLAFRRSDRAKGKDD